MSPGPRGLPAVPHESRNAPVRIELDSSLGTCTRRDRQLGLAIYDCRHAAGTTWLGSGAPLGEVARRLGHTVDTLVSVYVGALTGDKTVTNQRISDALSSTLDATWLRAA